VRAGAAAASGEGAAAPLPPGRSGWPPAASPPAARHAMQYELPGAPGCRMKWRCRQLTVYFFLRYICCSQEHALRHALPLSASSCRGTNAGTSVAVRAAGAAACGMPPPRSALACQGDTRPCCRRSWVMRTGAPVPAQSRAPHPRPLLMQTPVRHFGASRRTAGAPPPAPPAAAAGAGRGAA